VARQYALARLFNADAALTVAREARATFLDGLSHGQLVTLVHDLYAANQTALCVVGDETYTDALVAAAGTLPLAPKSKHLLGAFLQPTPEPNTVYVADMGSHQAYLASAGVVPLPTEADFAAMWLLDRLIGGMFTSALNLELRERRTLTYRAHSSLITSQAFGAWLFEAAIDGDQVLETLQAISEQFERLWVHISADEFLRARAMAVADLEARLETTGELLAWLTWRFQAGLEATDIRSFVESVRHLSREDVQTVARTYLPEKLGPIVIVGPSSHIRAQLQWSDYRVLDVADGTAQSMK
jgi:zinc protease